MSATMDDAVRVGVAVEKAGESGIASFVEFVGYMVVFGGVVAAIATVAAGGDGTAETGSPEYLVAALVLLTGAALGLVLVGLGTIVRYTKASAILLARALDERGP